jgi:hypothetical protein
MVYPYASCVAQLLVDGGDLVVVLTRGEKVWGFHGDIRVPLTSLQSVTVPSSPWLALRGWRMAGTGIRGRIALGTWRHGKGYDFNVVRRQRPAVQIDLSPTGRFSRFLIAVPDGLDADAEADRIAGAAGIARPKT